MPGRKDYQATTNRNESSTSWNRSSDYHPNDGNTTNGKHGDRIAKLGKTRTRGNTSGPAGDTSRNKASTVGKRQRQQQPPPPPPGPPSYINIYINYYYL
jgi:hypothetical protein